MLKNIIKVYVRKPDGELEIVFEETYEKFLELNPFYIESWDYVKSYFFNENEYIIFDTKEELEEFYYQMSCHESHGLTGIKSKFQHKCSEEENFYQGTFTYGDNVVNFSSIGEELAFRKFYEQDENANILTRRIS